MAEVDFTYAVSLFELAKEENKEKQVFDQLQAVSDSFKQNPDIYKLIATPALSKEERVDVVDKVLKDKVDPMVVNFVKVLVSNQRINSFNETVKAYKEHYQKVNNIVNVVVTTAKPLSDTQREKLLEKLKVQVQKPVELTEVIDLNIMGGIVLKIDNKEINASVKERLNDISKAIRA